MVPKGLFGWSPPHIQPLTPVSEVSEPPESPSPYLEMTEMVVAQEPSVEDTGDAEAAPASVPFFRLFSYADGFDWLLMVVGSLAAIVHGAALPLYLHLFGQIISWFGSNKDHSRQEVADEMAKHVLYILYIGGAVLIAGYLEVSCWILTGERQGVVLRSKYVQVLLKQEISFFDTFGKSGEVVKQITNDALLLQYAIGEKVGNYTHNMATCVGGLVVGFMNCWEVSLVTVASAPFVVAAGAISNVYLNKYAESVQDAYADAASIADQAISYARAVYSFANETLVKYTYANALQSTLRFGVQISLVQGLGLGCIYGIVLCSCALQLWVGRILVRHGKANGGEIIAAVFAVILSGLGLNRAATNFHAFEQGRIAAHRLFTMINYTQTGSSQEGRVLRNVQGLIDFRNVYFSYPSRPDIPILTGLHLILPAKKTLALVGTHGSGKSSVISLIQRFYDPTLGEVLLDGENIKNLQLGWLRSQMGLVSQEPALFAGSIKDNIQLGRMSATMDDIEEAAKIAHAHSFISSLEKGYSTQVGHDGLVLSPDKQLKVALARAVLKNPPILLLDEATSTLDVEAERVVQEALDIIMLNRSTVVIAHRLATIRNADIIAVLEEGTLVEFGTHEELLAYDGLYADLVRLQESSKPPRRSRSFVHQPVQPPAPTRVQVTEIHHSPKGLAKSPSLTRQNGVRLSDQAFLGEIGAPDSASLSKASSVSSVKKQEHDLPTITSDKPPSLRRQDSIETQFMANLPKLEIGSRQTSHNSNPESPVSPLLTTDPLSDRSHSKVFNRTISDIVASKQQDYQPGTKPSLWRLAMLSAPEWLYAFLGCIGAFLFGSFNPLFVFVVVQVAETYYYGDHRQMIHAVNKWSLIILGMGVATVFASFLQHFYFGIMGEKMTERVRRLLFSAILRSEVSWFDDPANSPEVLSMRLSIDATYVRAAFSNRLSVCVQDITAIAVATVIGLVLHWRVALVAVATAPLLLFAAICQQLWINGFSGDIKEAHKTAGALLDEAVTHIYTVVSFSAGEKMLELYQRQLVQPLREIAIQGQASGLAFGLSQGLLFACNALVLWYASEVFRHGHGSFSNVLKLFIVFSFTIFALVGAFGLAPFILKRRKSIIPVFDIINRRPKTDGDENAGFKPAATKGEVEFKNVEFRYPSRLDVPVLRNFNLRIPSGKTVAIVGTAGSGKSTIFALVERFYDPLSGCILLDGKDIKAYSLRWLRDHVGYVPQTPVMFSTTIRENIMYARTKATESEMIEAARIANAHHFITSLPHGYDTHLGMRGVQLSTGQKQRLAIARIVLKNPPILLLDEISAEVETESYRVVQEALEQLIMGNRTTIVVAHRLAMMRRVDSVAVLHNGKIVEEGSHDGLMSKCGLYARFMQPHFNKSLRHPRLV